MCRVGACGKEFASSTRTNLMWVGSLDGCSTGPDLLFIREEKVDFYEAFLEGNRNDDTGFFFFFTALCNCFKRYRDEIAAVLCVSLEKRFRWLTLEWIWTFLLAIHKLWTEFPESWCSHRFYLLKTSLKDFPAAIVRPCQVKPVISHFVDET